MAHAAMGNRVGTTAPPRRQRRRGINSLGYGLIVGTAPEDVAQLRRRLDEVGMRDPARADVLALLDRAADAGDADAMHTARMHIVLAGEGCTGYH